MMGHTLIGAGMALVFIGGFSGLYPSIMGEPDRSYVRLYALAAVALLLGGILCGWGQDILITAH